MEISTYFSTLYHVSHFLLPFKQKNHNKTLYQVTPSILYKGFLLPKKIIDFRFYVGVVEHNIKRKLSWHLLGKKKKKKLWRYSNQNESLNK